MAGSRRVKALRMVRDVGLIRPRELTAVGIPAWVLYELVAKGDVKRVGRGLYSVADYSPTENHSYAQVLKRTPDAILCLLSALRFHELTAENPREVWIAIPRAAWRPRSEESNLRVVRFSGEALTSGVEEHAVEGVSIRVTNVARTVADCFKYRNKIGLDVALAALREGWQKRRFSMDEFWRYAKLNRVTKVVMPYLETLPS